MSIISSPAFSIRIAARGPLSDTAASLSSGEFVPFVGPPTEIGKYGISWQHVSMYWDATHAEMQFMAKAQGGGSASHWIYSEVDDAWRSTTTDLVPGQAGHIWAVGFDPTRGDYYYLDFPMSELVRRMDRATESWTQTSSPSFSIRSQQGEGAIGFHPNLFGPGDSGLIAWCGTHLAAWRRSTDEWVSMHTFGSGEYWGNQYAGSMYVPGLDTLMLGTGFRHQNFMAVEAGTDGNLDALMPPLRPSPLAQGGGTNDHLPWGKMTLSPTDASKVLLLEAGPRRAGLRVFSSSNAGETWNLEPYTHPFHNLPWSDGDAGAWTLGTCNTHEVLWGMAYDGVVSQSLLWKPPS